MSNELGRRIKEARLAKKLTQAEVVGDFITRNMLSQIESGAALPSVKTLQYLSKVLEVPMSQLMPEDAPSEEAEGYLRARGLFEAGRYEEVADFPAVPDYPDELKALKAKSLLALAASYDEKDIASLQLAAERAKKAAALAEEGLFANASVRSEALLLLGSLAQKLSDYYTRMIGDEMSTVL